MPRRLSRSFGLSESAEVDGRRCSVADTGRLAGLLDAVAVVPGAFDRAWTGAFAAGGDEQGGEQGQVDGESVSPVRRGEWPPSRWRCGGSDLTCITTV